MKYVLLAVAVLFTAGLAFAADCCGCKCAKCQPGECQTCDCGCWAWVSLLGRVSFGVHAPFFAFEG